MLEEAQKYIAGGYNSPFRSFSEVGGYPIFMQSGKGSKVIDANGKTYIDYSLAWGPLILGHTHKNLINAIKKVSHNGWCFGTPTALETVFASLINKFFPSMEKIRLTNSGTEAVMSAIRLARGYTKKEKIIIFHGSYHGHNNDTLIKKQDSEKTLTASGIPRNTLKTTLIAQYNDINSVEELLEKNHGKVAAILIEPVAGNMGVVLPQENFLRKLKTACEKHGSLLIFDEVITGLRVSPGGAQSFFETAPDITILGKALAGGLSIGAFGGRSEIMEVLVPTGEVYEAGTFSGNPMTTSCGIEVLNTLSGQSKTIRLFESTAQLCNDLKNYIRENNFPVIINQIGSMFSVFFTTERQITTYSEAEKCDYKLFAKYFHFLLERGIYLSPSGMDTSFLSTAHTQADIEYTSAVIKEFLNRTFKK